MNAIMKLTAVAIGALGIAGGVAVAQGTTSPDTQGAQANTDTANVGTPAGAALKRDGSLRAKGTMATPADQSTDMSAPAAPTPAPKPDRN